MSNSINKTLGETIKEALKEKGLNQSAVAKKMNVSKQVINQIDRRKYFDLEFLHRLKLATGLDFTSQLVLEQTSVFDNMKTDEVRKTDEPIVEYGRGEKQTTITLNFMVPSSSLQNLPSFMSGITEISKRYNINLL